jgi:hypothetical protein
MASAVVVNAVVKLDVDVTGGREMPHAKKLGKVTYHPVRSSNIHSLGYDADRKELHVKFHSGSEGHYNHVDYSLFTVLLAAPSKGKALHALITKHPEKHPWTPHTKSTRG